MADNDMPDEGELELKLEELAEMLQDSPIAAAPPPDDAFTRIREDYNKYRYGKEIKFNTSNSSGWVSTATIDPGIIMKKQQPVFGGSYKRPDCMGYWGRVELNSDGALVDLVPIEVIEGGRYRLVRDIDNTLRPVDTLEPGVYLFIF